MVIERRVSRSGRLWSGGSRDEMWALSLAAALVAGLALRVWFIAHYSRVAGDSLVYGNIAKNVLEHGVYGFTVTLKGVPVAPRPTLIRLPGYPLFLMGCFKLFGTDGYPAVLLVQAFVDLWTCLLIAGVAVRLSGRGAGMAALWMSALCPFTANYVATPLTETLTLWTIALAFYGLARWRGRAGWQWIGIIGFALAYAILLRPEQGLLAAAVVPAIFLSGERRQWTAALVVSALTLLPLVPWTIRNERTFHVFEPLAPRFANDPGEVNPYGFQRWYRTWGIEFTTTETVYWNYDDDVIQIADLPNRAFDSNPEYAATEALLADYDKTDTATVALDRRFAAIAQARVAHDPLRYYLALPVARVVNMVLRPRTEMMPVPLEWWKIGSYGWVSVFAGGYALLNLAYLVLAGVGFALRRRWWSDPLVWAMLATVLLRCALLLTLDNSEPRYTLEFFPVLIVLGAEVVGRIRVNPRSSTIGSV